MSPFVSSAALETTETFVLKSEVVVKQAVALGQRILVYHTFMKVCIFDDGDTLQRKATLSY